jgi:DNA-binding CsgD family transcriptional regulator
MLTKYFMEFLATEPNAIELAKFMVHGGFSEPEPRGAAVALIDDEGHVEEIARYGLTGTDSFVQKIPLWKDVPPFSAIRSGKPATLAAHSVIEASTKENLQIQPDSWMKSIFVIPVMKQRIPFGAVVLFYDRELPQNPQFRIDVQHFSGLTCLALQNLKLIRGLEKPKVKLLPVMTDRQKQILLLVARGFTNKEIASEKSMTLATVKQEISRILTALDVSSRKEAVEKAREALASGEL